MSSPSDPKWSLSGRTALVTGASRGIGRATALALDRSGARVALVARSADALTEVAAGLANDPVVITADLAGEHAPVAVAAAALTAFGVVDVLVNNAAVAVRQPAVDLTVSTVDALLQVNVRSLLLLSARLIPAMVEAGGGSIVNVSSISGLRGTPRRAAYAASKSAVDGMTRALAQEYGPAGIRVNAVAPGIVDTDLWAYNKQLPGVVEQTTQHIPLRRWGTPEEVADVIVFLASDAARYVTAQTLGVDGGMANTLDLFGSSVSEPTG